jgi:outer membrane protein assembly factor BamB
VIESEEEDQTMRMNNVTKKITLNSLKRQVRSMLISTISAQLHFLQQRRFMPGTIVIILLSLFMLTAMGANMPPSFAASTVNAASGGWPTYLHDNQRSGAASDTTLSVNNAAQLAPKWTFKTGGGIASQPVVVGNTAYIGSWDGYEYALNATTGALQWKTFLGQTVVPACVPATTGITSTPTVQNGVVYVGGGDRYWYALDASSGKVLWKIDTGDNSITGGHYNWSSPLIANGYAYIGIASDCDIPLVQGLLLKVDLSTHQLAGTLKLVPDGQVGGGIWTSPSLDPATNTIYVTTGTLSEPTQIYAQAILAVNATTMAVTDVWQIPPDVAGIDLDWGTTPMLFTDAKGRQLVASSNKDGILYAFERSNLAAGPVWQTPVAITGDCPVCGFGTVSTTAIGSNRIYIAGGNSMINGQGYPGAIRAVDPQTGSILWQHGTTDPVIPALTYVNGLVIDGAGSMFEVRDASNGNILYSYQTSGIYGAASVSNGMIFDGALDGTVYAFGLSSTPTPPPDANCPAGWTCQDLGNAMPAGSETVKNGTWNVSAGGVGVGGTGDQYRSLTENITGDTQISARITALPLKGDAQAGFILRQSTDPGSPYYAVFVQPNNELVVQYRSAYGGTTNIAEQITSAQVPIYLKVQRIGDVVQVATSVDGTNYTLIPGSTLTEVFPATIMVGLGVSSDVNGTLSSATFTNVAISAPGTVMTPKPASPCPVGWTCGDVGNPALVGDQSLKNGVWQMKAAGSDINNFSDQFHYAWQPMTGNVTVSAHVTAQDNTSAGAKAGVMLRQSTDPGSLYYGVFVTPGQGIIVQYRLAQGARTEQITVPGVVPAYLRVSRWNTSFTAYTSSDGVTWTPVEDATEVLTFPSTLQVGLATTAQNGAMLGSVTMNSVLVVAGASVPPVLCPAGWNCADIANSFPAGSEALNNGTWTIRAGGSDIWSLYDQFHFDWQSLLGDGSISAHIVSLLDTDPWAKAGVMLRQSADAAAPYYAALITPGNALAIQYRLTQKGDSTLIPVSGTIPTYLKVARAGTIFSTYTSSDGVKWTLVPGSSLRVGLTGTLVAGLAVTSHTTSARTTAVIDAVNIVTSAVAPATNCPLTWNCADIGNPLIVGSETLNNGTWNIQGGGSDIWGTADQFHFDWQSLSGNGAVRAHITAQSNTDPWAKAGVMLRQSNDPGAPYYAVFTTPGNGIVVQYRTTQGGTTTNITIAGTVPTYLKVARSGTIFVAYTSQNGTIWTPIAKSSVTITMAGNYLGGLALCSHNEGLFGSATFDTVSIG